MGKLPDNNLFPDLLTEEELIRFLRIPEISKAQDHHNVIENLKRMHGLPRIHICGKPLYPIEAIRKWIKEKIKTLPKNSCKSHMLYVLKSF